MCVLNVGNRMIKSLDLFSGIGGFALGFHWAGIETAAFCEIEDYPTKVLKKNFPNIPIHRDIKELNGYDYEGIDIVTGGFPCQPHSVAGQRKASEDARDLWGEMYRVIRQAQPKWVVAENVPGLLSSESGRYFGRVLRDLAQEGYCTQWFCIPASALGAWHKRERIWIVANKRKISDSNLSATRNKVLRKIEGEKETGQAYRPSRSNLSARDGESPADSNCDRLQARRLAERIQSQLTEFGVDSESNQFYFWEVEPAVGRVANGVSNRVDRIKSLGNAVVPQIPYVIGKAIVEVENEAQIDGRS